MRMLVLAGGFGTRLKPVVNDVPKALAPIGDVPFLYLQIENWIKQGLSSFVFLLHHQADLIIKFLLEEREGLLKGREVAWVIEETPMDTGGAIAYAVRELHLDGTFLVTNADTWLGDGIAHLFKSATPAMAVIKRENVSRYGQVLFDSTGQISAFSEKGVSVEPGWINAGLCHLDANLFMDWDGQAFSLERSAFAALVKAGKMTAVPLQTDFIDIGIPEDYYLFKSWVEKGRQVPLCN
jgi:D-glycero-alpha-D-manno-heptose 1-phosphate guanylyltransferase